MRNTLSKLKAIFSANLNLLVTSAILSAVAYLAVFLIVAHTTSWVDDLRITQKWTLLFVSLVFGLPIIDYLAFHASLLSSGIKNAEINTKTMKRNLFIVAGILWSSLGCLVFTLILGTTEYLAMLSALVALLSWYFIHKLLVKYVFTL